MAVRCQPGALGRRPGWPLLARRPLVTRCGRPAWPAPRRHMEEPGMLLTKPEAALLEEFLTRRTSPRRHRSGTPRWPLGARSPRKERSRRWCRPAQHRTQPRLTYRASSRTQWRLAVIHVRRKPRCFAGPYCYERAVVVERLAREVQGVPELGQTGRAGEEHFQE